MVSDPLSCISYSGGPRACVRRGGEIGRVNVSAYTAHLIQADFACEYRGKLGAKGKGEIDMYFVLRERTTANAVQPVA